MASCEMVMEEGGGERTGEGKTEDAEEVHTLTFPERSRDQEELGGRSSLNIATMVCSISDRLTAGQTSRQWRPVHVPTSRTHGRCSLELNFCSIEIEYLITVIKCTMLLTHVVVVTMTIWVHMSESCEHVPYFLVVCLWVQSLHQKQCGEDAPCGGREGRGRGRCSGARY